MRHIELGRIIAPAKVRRAGNTAYPVLSMTMRDGLVNQSDKFKKRIASADTSPYKIVEKNQLVIGFPIDEGVLAFQRLYDEAIVSPAYNIWDIKDGASIDREFLERFLRSPLALDFYKSKLRSSTARRRTLPNDIFLSLEVPCPPLAEQERIVKLLEEADALRKLRAQADRRTAALLPALFDELFGGSTKIPVKRFGELLSEPLRNGVSPSKDGTFTGKVFTLSAITGTSFDPTAFKEAPFARAAEEHCYASENLFLICRGNGNRELVGSGKFPAKIGERIIFPDTMIAAVPNLDALSPAFLEAAWESPFVRRQIHAVARTTNGTYKVNQTGLEEIQIPVPPLPLQQTFARRVGEIRELEAAQAASRRRLDALFASLLHRAFAGEL